MDSRHVNRRVGYVKQRTFCEGNGYFPPRKPSSNTQKVAKGNTFPAHATNLQGYGDSAQGNQAPQQNYGRTPMYGSNFQQQPYGQAYPPQLYGQMFPQQPHVHPGQPYGQTYPQPPYGQVYPQPPHVQQGHPYNFVGQTGMPSYGAYSPANLPVASMQNQGQHRCKPMPDWQSLLKRTPPEALALGGLVFLALLALLASVSWLKWIVALLAAGSMLWAFRSLHTKYRKVMMTSCACLSVIMIILALAGNTAADLSTNSNLPRQAYVATSVTMVPQTNAPVAVIIAESTVTPTPTEVPTATPSPAPTATPAVAANQNVTHDGIATDMTLYYNTDGGNYYYTKNDCSSVNRKYLPLKGTIIYEQLTESKFKNLKPCTTCAAPVRPHSH